MLFRLLAYEDWEMDQQIKEDKLLYEGDSNFFKRLYSAPTIILLEDNHTIASAILPLILSTLIFPIKSTILSFKVLYKCIFSLGSRKFKKRIGRIHN